MTYDEAIEKIQPEKKYRYFKGKEYEVVCVARNLEETNNLQKMLKGFFLSP